MVTDLKHAQMEASLRDEEENSAVTGPPPPVLTDRSQFLMATGLMSDDGQCLNVILRSTPPCPDGNKPRTCADGSEPERLRGGRGGARREDRREQRRGGRRGRCSRDEKICCDGSTPSFDGDRSTPPCADGSRPK